MTWGVGKLEGGHNFLGYLCRESLFLGISVGGVTFLGYWFSAIFGHIQPDYTIIKHQFSLPLTRQLINFVTTIAMIYPYHHMFCDLGGGHFLLAYSRG